MGHPPFFAPFDDDQTSAPTAVIVEFPRAVILQADLREARRQVERLEQQLADNDIRSRDRQEQIRAACAVPMLDFWRGELNKAEAAVAMLDAADTLTFGGQTYRAICSLSGAN